MALTKFSAGDIVILETGAYSDRYTVGCFQILRDIPVAEWNSVRLRYQTGDPKSMFCFGDAVQAHEMTAEMIRLGMIRDADHVHEIHADYDPGGD